jgi:hypothetical protein
MSNVIKQKAVRGERAPMASSRLPAWTREPLLHFVMLGALLFAADYLLIDRDDDPQTIVLDASIDTEAKRMFETSRGRPPNAEELAALRQVWLDNEVLYREGLAMGLDQGDDAIRERVIFKALSVVDANTKLPPYDEQVLRAWFEKNRARYDEPVRFDFQEAVLSGEATESNVRAFVSALNSGTAPDVEASLRVFDGRPHSNIVQSYGAEFAQALESSQPGEWRALRAGKTWRAMRLENITPGKPADFDAIQGRVLQDWTDTTLAEQRSAAVRVWAKKYAVKIEEAAQ